MQESKQKVIKIVSLVKNGGWGWGGGESTMHTCHKLLTEICEILQIFKGDLMKFCEIFMKITFKLT